jgi:S-adenosylmethionine:tRNA ribosyltransferase-isomerase
MKLSDFDYDLPPKLIAQYPMEERDKARLLVLDRRKKTIEHRIFRDIGDYLKKDAETLMPEKPYDPHVWIETHRV